MLGLICELKQAHQGFKDNTLISSLFPRRENCSNCETLLSVGEGTPVRVVVEALGERKGKESGLYYTNHPVSTSYVRVSHG